MYNFDEGIVRSELEKLIDPDAKIKMPFPFKDLIGPQSFFTTCYAPLFDAFPDLERRMVNQMVIQMVMDKQNFQKEIKAY